MGNAMRAWLVAAIMIASLPTLVRAQSGTDVSPAIPVHPDVPTILHLPDEIEGAWAIGGKVLMLQGVGSKLYVRPRPDTPAGQEAWLEVKTRTLHRIFAVRVVERAEDAMREVVVPAAPAANDAGAAAQREAAPAAAAKEESAASEPSPEPSQAPASAEPGQAPVAPSPAPIAAAARSRPLELSVHAVGGVGFTGLEVAGHRSRVALQPHAGAGLRLTLARPGSWLALEANVNGEWLAGPMVYDQPGTNKQLWVNGPRLGAEVGLRAQTGTRWIPTACARLGVQMHLSRRSKAPDSGGNAGSSSVEEMKEGAVLTVGMGLQYRTRGALLGVEFQIRHGGLDEYRSIAALLSVGRFLNQGE
jgi:hypothetical protein